MLRRATCILINNTKSQHHIRSNFNKSIIKRTYKYFIHESLIPRIDRNKYSFHNNPATMVKTRSKRDTNAVSLALKNNKRTITSTTRKPTNKRRVQKKTTGRNKKKGFN